MPGMGGMGGMGGMDPQMMAGVFDMMTPEMMQQMIESNPMLKQMADSNPQVKAMLNNPQLMKQMLQNISNTFSIQLLLKCSKLKLWEWAWEAEWEEWPVWEAWEVSEEWEAWEDSAECQVHLEQQALKEQPEH